LTSGKGRTAATVDYSYLVAKTSYDVTQGLHFGFGGF